jgi:hypothetical protein
MFELNGINYDDYIVMKKYKMNRTPEYGGTEYRDGWWKRHRTIVRYSINGSVTLAFPNAETYNDFIDNVAGSMGPDGDYLIKVYVQETNSVEEIRAFLTPTARTAIATKPYGYAPVFFNVTLKVEER